MPNILTFRHLFQEHEEYSSYQAAECHKMVPLQGLTLEEDNGEESEDSDRDNLLYHLQLHKAEGTAIAHETDTVGRYLTGILKECQEPADKDNDVKRCVVRDELHLLQLEMSVPSKRHKDV